MPEVRARIASIAHHDSGVSLISLTANRSFHFRAGQYLNVVHPGGVRIPMSIASGPERLPRVELHFRALPGVPEAALMNELLDVSSNASRDLSIDGPFGNVCVDGPLDADVLLIAGGSGVAQCRAIVDHLSHTQHTRSVTLVWSVTEPTQLYCDTELRRFPSWLEYVPVVDTPQAKNAAVAWLNQAPLTTFGRIIISGGPGFVYAVVDALAAVCSTDPSIESDVFSYAPR